MESQIFYTIDVQEEGVEVVKSRLVEEELERIIVTDLEQAKSEANEKLNQARKTEKDAMEFLLAVEKHESSLEVEQEPVKETS